jgi:hypothetical protein
LAVVEENLAAINKEIQAIPPELKMLDTDKQTEAYLLQLSDLDVKYELARIDLEANNPIAEKLQATKDELATLLVRYNKRDELLSLARSLHGHLTATLHATEDDLRKYADLVQVLTTKVGRLVLNGYPTGVEVCHAMVHGGPYPATSDGRSTSVGTHAIFRFARLVCWQGFPDAALPEELQQKNPLGIWRLVDGELAR